MRENWAQNLANQKEKKKSKHKSIKVGWTRTKSGRPANCRRPIESASRWNYFRLPIKAHHFRTFHVCLISQRGQLERNLKLVLVFWTKKTTPPGGRSRNNKNESKVKSFEKSTQRFQIYHFYLSDAKSKIAIKKSFQKYSPRLWQEGNSIPHLEYFSALIFLQNWRLTQLFNYCYSLESVSVVHSLFVSFGNRINKHIHGGMKLCYKNILECEYRFLI